METGVFQPSPADYMALQYLNRLSGGRLLQILNDHGARGLSICPLCKIGDFLHSRNGFLTCRLDLRPGDFEKIQSVEPVGKIITRKAMKTRTKGIKP